MNLTDFIQLGVAGIAVVVIWFIVQGFLKFAEKQEDNFRNTINEHLTMNKKANEELAQAIRELLMYLKGKNNK